MLPYTLTSSNITSVAEQLSSPTEKTGHRMQNSESFKQQTVRRYEESAGATVLEVNAERDIDGTLIRKCDHIHTKKRYTPIKTAK